MTTDAKPKRGPPFKPNDQRLEQRSIRLLPSQWAKYEAAGGIEWLRGLIDRAKPKAPPES